MNRHFFVLLIFVCFFSGCVSSWTWSNGEKLAKGRMFGLEARSPAGWYRKRINKAFFFTKHDLSIEHTILERQKWTDTLSNGLRLPQKVLLHEIPQIVLGEMCAYSIAFDLKISGNEIRRIDGLPCSFVNYTYTSYNGLKMKGIMYCIPLRKYVTIIRFAAEESVYYKASYEEFMKFVSGIKIRERKYLLLPGIHLSRTDS